MVVTYILRGTEVVPEPDVERWARWMGQQSPGRIALTRVGHVRVSTVFMGLSPTIFHTRVLDGAYAGESASYATWEAAVRGHAAMVARIQGGAVGEPEDIPDAP